jgi:creatinine amidohydrolase
VWDALGFAHGPFQQLFAHDATLVALSRADAADEPDLLARTRSMLTSRQQLRSLQAELPGAFAALEHEAHANALLVRWLEEQRLDPTDWPGRGRDEPLYELGRRPMRRARPATGSPPARRLETSTWPELEAALAAGRRTALVPLGSTEQHGPHLPFATDTWVADALGRRLCVRLPDAVCCPALVLGCASEHASFPGTLSLEPGTLEAVLHDVLRSLRAHGFERAFVFSAHGGNLAALRDALPRLRSALEPFPVLCVTEHDRVTHACSRTAAGFGVSPEASGQHAGELETSIVAALCPAAVRRDRLEAGLLAPAPTPRDLFYPDLRRNAPNGVVGDPRGADAARADAYLEAWVDVLEEIYREQKKRHHTNGTVNA